jgi:hypothetical protein
LISRNANADTEPPRDATGGESKFWQLAQPLLARPDVTRSTMMGLPCLRINGAFFASLDRKTGALLVKLPETTVDRLVSTGRGEPFAPAGRRFREWAAIPAANARSWRRLLSQAFDHVSSQSSRSGNASADDATRRPAR